VNQSKKRERDRSKEQIRTPKEEELQQNQLNHPIERDAPLERVEKVEMTFANGSEKQEWKTPSIFISYRRSDSPNITGRIYDRLIQEYGKAAVFKDVDSIPLGVDFRTFIDQKVGECDVILIIIGDTWLTVKNEQGQRRIDDTLDFVYLEIEAALRREIPVIPILVQGVEMPTADDLPEGIQGLAFRNGIQVRPDPDFHNDMNRMIKGLEPYGWR
jgi:hypothetical protein